MHSLDLRYLQPPLKMASSITLAGLVEQCWEG